MTTTQRCAWAKTQRSIDYHDREWGVPVRDERTLFEFLVLEGAQAGLSWETILAKRDAYRDAFHNFEPDRVARMTARDVERLMGNPAIVRNRMKIESAVANAGATLRLREAEGLPVFLWSFVGGAPINSQRRTLRDIPASTPESTAMSKALKKQGMNFVGPTICYAFMQAVGMVNDHLVSCPRHAAVRAAAKERA